LEIFSSNYKLSENQLLEIEMMEEELKIDLEEKEVAIVNE
jgi:hypothetical protein